MQIHLYDKFAPEDLAMLQALYSRSPASVTEHTEKVAATGSGKFMETYYIGYSHKSIGDCGSTTLFFEGVSELAAKAVQDWPLYSGQQTSTRYIDFTSQPLLDPLAVEDSALILESWMAFYRESLPVQQQWLTEQFAVGQGEDEGRFRRAVNARAFDVLRAFLPAGVTTQLSWHTNLRQAGDKLAQLRHHPLSEVQELAQQALQLLRGRYPHSFPKKERPAQENWLAECAPLTTYYDTDTCPDFAYSSTIQRGQFEQWRTLLQQRPRGGEVPAQLEELGQITFDFLLDYGSFRDVQRHRRGVCRMPLLSPRYGFHNWYLENLAPQLRECARDLIIKQTERIRRLQCDPETAQYYCALGYRVPCRFTWGLPEAVYVTELRSGATVHPTLRTVAHRMDSALRESLPGLVLHSDLSADKFSVRRGDQDIREKQK